MTRKKVLKCWKKISDTKYINKKRKGVLYIFDGDTVSISIDTVKIDEVEFPKTVIHEEFKTKPQALSFANKYMKEHDSC